MSSRCRDARRVLVALALVATSVAAACGGGSDPPRAEVVLPGRQAMAMTSELQAGTVRRVSTVNPFEGDQRALADGERLFKGMNCAGCHGAQGGGGMGPPLRDRDWIYGDDPPNIFQSIAQGRPNGMPAFGHMLPDELIWKIALFVESLGQQAVEASAGQGATGGPTEAMRRRQPSDTGGQQQ